MKCSELYRLLKKDGWYPISQKGSHVKLKHDKKQNIIIFPNHGSQELGKGFKKKDQKRRWIKIEKYENNKEENNVDS
jgi:predicted RNA binding protein YcfA (HicA-like mRNA interferase family)